MTVKVKTEKMDPVMAALLRACNKLRAKTLTDGIAPPKLAMERTNLTIAVMAMLRAGQIRLDNYICLFDKDLITVREIGCGTPSCVAGWVVRLFGPAKLEYAWTPRMNDLSGARVGSGIRMPGRKHQFDQWAAFSDVAADLLGYDLAADGMYSTDSAHLFGTSPYGYGNRDYSVAIARLVNHKVRLIAKLDAQEASHVGE